MDAAGKTQIYRFGEFELDLGAHQLRLRGRPVHLERRPLDLLIMLVSRHGLLVPRDEIITALWPKVIIDFDTGLNTLVRKVRRALGDSSDAPTFIETVPGLGYRFIAPLTAADTAAPMPGALAPAETIVAAPRGARRLTRGVAAATLLTVAAVVAVTVTLRFGAAPVPIGIVVLPFENLTQNVELDYLAAGLAEDTMASLAQIDLGNLRLVGQSSAQPYTASDKPMPQVGRELGVDYVVASSLRAEVSKIRVTTRLIRAADSTQLWTASFDRELTSMLGLQRELSVAIAEQVRLRLSPEVSATIARRQTANPQAYDLYLRGRYMWSLLSPATNRRALEYFEQAIEQDPTYALAWAGIAQVLSTAPITGDAEPAAVAARAREAVDRALRYGADLTEVQYALGYFHFFIDWDWPAAEVALRRAVELDPNNAIAHLMLGHVCSQLGDHFEALGFARRARELDPFFSHTFALSAQIAFQAREYAMALEFARQAVAINPEGWVGHVHIGQELAQLGRYDESIPAYDVAVRYSGGNSKAVGYRAHALASMGRNDEARAALAELEARAHERYTSPYVIGIVYAALGESEAALDWLERAMAVGDVHMVFLPHDPRWDPLRREPRFLRLMARFDFSRRVGGMNTPG